MGGHTPCPPMIMIEGLLDNEGQSCKGTYQTSADLHERENRFISEKVISG